MANVPPDTVCLHCGQGLPHPGDTWRGIYRCRVIEAIYDAGGVAERERIRQLAVQVGARYTAPLAASVPLAVNLPPPTRPFGDLLKEPS